MGQAQKALPDCLPRADKEMINDTDGTEPQQNSSLRREDGPYRCQLKKLFHQGDAIGRKGRPQVEPHQQEGSRQIRISRMAAVHFIEQVRDECPERKSAKCCSQPRYQDAVRLADREQRESQQQEGDRQRILPDKRKNLPEQESRSHRTDADEGKDVASIRGIAIADGRHERRYANGDRHVKHDHHKKQCNIPERPRT